MEFDELIADFAKRHNVEDLVVVDGIAALDIDGIVVTMLHGEGMLVLSAEIGDPPAEGAAVFAGLLLEANLQSSAVFAKKQDGGSYVVLRRLPLATVDGNAFDTALEEFVNLVETWRRLLVDFRPVAVKAAESAAAGPSFGSTSFMQV